MERELVRQSGSSGGLAPAAVPAIITATGKRGAARFFDFFTANIRNPNTRRAYYRAVGDFLNWLQEKNVHELAHVQPIHVSGYIEELQATHAAPSVKQHLAAIRMLLDWLVTGQVIPTNPAHSVRGPRHSAKKGKTPVLSPEEARELLDSIAILRTVKLKDGSEKEEPLLVGLRDRALIGLMVYTFARVGAAVTMNVEDYYYQGRRWWVRLHEKGGKRHEMPAHHNLDEYL